MMKKNIVLIALIVCTFTASQLMARGCPGGGCRPCPPPPPCPGGWGWRGGWGWNCDRGLGNAAAITSIVANGLSIVGSLTYPRTTVVTQPVYTAPVVTQPVVAQPVYAAPAYVAPAPVVVQPGGPLPPGTIVGGCPAVRYGGGCVYY